jgi:predicted transcriptional regulator
MPTQSKPMGIKLSEHDRERLKRLAETRKRAPHWLAKEAIAQYLEREEVVERFRQESISAWEEYQRTGRSVPNDQVMAWLDSWGSEDEREAP